MSVKELTQEEIEHLSMIELGAMILKEENKAMAFQDLFAKITDLKELSEEEKTNFMAQLYTDINVDGRFLTLGSGMWGLKRWYPVEQAEEEITDESKRKKSKKKKKAAAPEVADDDLDVTDEDIDDLMDEFGDDLEDDDFDGDFEEEEEVPADEIDELDYNDEDEDR